MIKKLSLGLIIRLVGMTLTFFSGVFMARSLGVDGFGIYGIIISFASILAIPSQSGFGNFIIKEVARSTDKKNSNYGYLINKWAAKRSLIISTAIAILVIAYLLFSSKYSDNLFAYTLGTISVILMGQNVASYSYLKGIGRTELGQVVEALVYPAAFLLMSISIWLIADLTLDTVMVLRCIALLLVSLLGYFFVKSSVKKSKNNVENNEYLNDKMFKRQLVPFALSDGIRVAQAHMFILIVGWLLSTSDAGQFKVVQSLVLFLQLPATVLITVLAPEISKYCNKDLERVNENIKNSKRLNILCSLLGVVGVYLFSSELINFAFGEQYNVVSKLLLIIAMCFFVSSFFGFGDVVLNMTGKGELVLKLSIIILLITIMIAVIFMKYYGVLGAAYSFGISIILQRILFYAVARKFSNVKV
nr:oligosaccharide flippase family protein [uncultured Vibrio sp.]